MVQIWKSVGEKAEDIKRVLRCSYMLDQTCCWKAMVVESSLSTETVKEEEEGAKGLCREPSLICCSALCSSAAHVHCCSHVLVSARPTACDTVKRT